METSHKAIKKQKEIETDEIMHPLSIRENCEVWAVVLSGQILLISLLVLIFKI